MCLTIGLLLGGSCGGGSGGSPSGPTPARSVFRGSFSGQYLVTTRQLTNSFTCADTRTVEGTLTLSLDRTSPTVAGTADLTGTQATVATTCPLGRVESFPFRSESIEVTGRPENLAFTHVFTEVGQLSTGERIERTFTRAFSGTLNDGVISGAITFADRYETATSRGEGGVTMVVTAR